MSHTYKPIHWNRQKRLYDATLVTLLVGVSGLFAATTLLANPATTIETLIIRTTSVSAFLLLHVILCIGPLARLDQRFLPLLYNRRHLGVTMFLLALVHAVFAIIQFHALSDANPIVSVFTAYRMDYNVIGRPSAALGNFPFEPFGALALVILFFMAATSHDFWLRNLGASFWKLMHLLVYVAYGALLVHVFYGALQYERNPLYIALAAAGFLIVTLLHILAYRKEARLDREKSAAEIDGYIDACAVKALRDGRGKPVKVGGERIALFRDRDRIFALSNVCRHQGGPVGEGRIVDGCVTCPWHGWQYRPEDGCSPPPFAEVIHTYDVRVIDDRIYVRRERNPLKTRCEGAAVTSSADGAAPDDSFYIGYLKKAPALLAGFVRVRTVILAATVLLVAFILGIGQAPVDSGTFQFGAYRTFEGVLTEMPVPMLRLTVPSVGAASGQNVLLVGFGKSGLPEYARAGNGKRVQFRGSLITRENMTMIEMNDPDSFAILGAPEPEQQHRRVETVGRVKLTGELVDTKCYFGVMRPATGKIHRACAVRCLSGGAPPGLLIRHAGDAASVVLLAGAGDSLLEFDPQWAALPVEASGTLELYEGVPVLRADSLTLTAQPE